MIIVTAAAFWERHGMSGLAENWRLELKANAKATAIMSRFGYAFASAFGRAEAASQLLERPKAEAWGYLRARATAKSKS